MTRTAFGDDDPADRISNPLQSAAGALVPQWLARRAIQVSVQTDKKHYSAGETVHITIEFCNRLPVPVELRTTQRIWGWEVNGFPEASDERRYMSDSLGSLLFRAKERKRIHRRWDGTIKRNDRLTRWVPAHGTKHEINAFIDVTTGSRLEASRTVQLDR